MRLRHPHATSRRRGGVRLTIDSRRRFKQCVPMADRFERGRFLQQVERLRGGLDGAQPVEVEITRTERWVVRVPPAPGLPARIASRPGLLIDERPVRRQSVTRLAVLAGVPLALAGGAIGWFNGSFDRQSRVAAAPPPAVVIDLDEAKKPVRTEATKIPHRVDRAAAPAAVVPPISAAIAPAAAPTAIPSPQAAPVALDALPEVRAAVDRAFQSNVAEPWAADGLEGYAVAGPIQIDGKVACRNVAIWAQGPGAPGAAIGGRKCMVEGGSWTDAD